MFDLSPLPGGDQGIVNTVAKIKSAIYSSLREPEQKIRKRAEDIIRASGVGERNEDAEIRAIASWVKAHFHYVHDVQGIEYVKSPVYIDDEISSYGKFIGDCDDAAGYLAALLKSLGYRVNLTIIADKRNPRQNFSHIFAQAFSRKMSKWFPLDMTAKGRPLTWTPPISRARSYDV